MTISLRLILCSFPACFLFVSGWASAEETPVDFNRDIRPILSRNCFACHGPDEEAREAELRLDTAEGATRDLGGHRAVNVQAPDQSELLKRIESSDPDLVMPPSESGHEMSAEEKQLLRTWVESGAKYEIHWSFSLPLKTELPKVKNTNWPLTELDHFVLAKLEAENLSPAEQADRYQYIRRVSLDLTGLPPTPEEADAFIADSSDSAFEKVVDRLLASPAFGEHWARMWLDLARYADTKGYEKDLPRQMWRYRDWVIAALNADMPFEQFTYEQLAGDLFDSPTTDQLIATAFHRNTMTNDEGGTDNEEFRVAAVKDRVDTTMQVWMGLTMGCAKCHSHKYDPISQNDYYAFYSFFNQTEDADRYNDAPVLASPTSMQTAQIKEFETEVNRLNSELAKPSEEFEAAYKQWRAQYQNPPLWQRLKKQDFASKHEVTLNQKDDGTLVAQGTQPERDTWTLTLDLPDTGLLTSLRLDLLTQKLAGGDWPDRNVALRELTATLIEPDQDPVLVKLTNPRADFSQNGWEVAKAIDGNPDVGWAISPQIGKPHVAIFDFEKPFNVSPQSKLQLVLDQEYGSSLLLNQFRVSISSYPVKMLAPALDVEAGLKERFAREEFGATKQIYTKLGAVQKKLTTVKAEIPKTPIMRELAQSKQRITHLQNRGNFLDPGDPVLAGVPEIFGNWPSEAPQNRLGVAKWLLQPENPLTTRVTVNRIWARLFGMGIVETEEDFGAQGLPPSNPELLDWLAVDFRENDWSLKQLMRKIVLSATYRQSSQVTREKLEADPRNIFLSRSSRFRLPAETVRDQALAVSGLLTQKIGGPSVMPPQPDGVWQSTYSVLKWKDAEGPERYRRGLYTYWKRTSPYPAMIAFDAGSGEVCQIRRVRTNTPLQALVTLNDPAFVEAAGALAKRMSETPGSIENKLTQGFRLVLTRPPSKQEAARIVELYEAMGEQYKQDQDATKSFLEAAGAIDGDAAMVTVANVLLNLDETLMRP